MSLTLASITFNHDLQSSAQSALNLRRNKDFEVLLPEWPLTVGTSPTERPAAYAIADTFRQDVIVKAAISSTAAGDFEIRATGGGVLGAIAPTPLTIAANATTVVDAHLTQRRFDVVGRHDVQWQWSFRPVGPGPWIPFATTDHRIYLTLAAPAAPWTQTAGSAHLPWADLLDFACAATSGFAQNHPFSITRSLVRAINESLDLRYDIVTAGSGRYGYVRTGDLFELTEWIEYVLRNQPPAETVCDPDSGHHPLQHVVGCYDTAASLVLMATILGADLRYQFHEPFGFLHPCHPIGRAYGNNPHYYPSCVSQPPLVGVDTPRTHFVNHTYTTDPDNRVFDACLRASVSLLAYLIYLIVAFIWSIFRPDLAYEYWDRAHGTITRRTQLDYQTSFIDTSTPLEQGLAGGTPVPEVVDFATM
jgi:hypothetical protein